MTSVFDAYENIDGKGENAVYKRVLLFQQCFQVFNSLLPS